MTRVSILSNCDWISLENDAYWLNMGLHVLWILHDKSQCVYYSHAYGKVVDTAYGIGYTKIYVNAKKRGGILELTSLDTRGNHL